VKASFCPAETLKQQVVKLCDLFWHLRSEVVLLAYVLLEVIELKQSRIVGFDDPTVKPPFRLRWATKRCGLFKQAIRATEEDVVHVTLGGLVVCREQMTGRIRWRHYSPGQALCRSAWLAAGSLLVFV